MRLLASFPRVRAIIRVYIHCTEKCALCVPRNIIGHGQYGHKHSAASTGVAVGKCKLFVLLHTCHNHQHWQDLRLSHLVHSLTLTRCMPHKLSFPSKQTVNPRLLPKRRTKRGDTLAHTSRQPSAPHNAGTSSLEASLVCGVESLKQKRRPPDHA